MGETQGREQASDSANTFPAFLRQIASQYGSETAVSLINGSGVDETISFAELEKLSAMFARGLLGRGIGKGSRIGFIAGNGPAFAVTLAAIARIGAIAIPLSTLAKSDELVRLLRQSDVHGLITQRSLMGHDLVERLCDALPELRIASDPDLRLEQAPFLRWIAADGPDLPASFQTMDWIRAGAATVSDTLLQEVESEVHPTDQMVEIYTSGSMALPKGVRHLHGAVLERARYLARMTGRVRRQKVPVPLPMFWVGGMGLSLLANLSAGANSVCGLATLSDSKLAMGTVMTDEALAIVARSKPYWGLGMSETFGPYAYGNEVRAMGYPLCAPLDHVAEGFEIRVVDGQCRAVGEGEVGEIQVRGDGLTPGLHKIDRKEGFTPDGFYRTGDLGLIEGARIHFVGRDGDMIKTNGANVSPAEVEMELQAIVGIESAYVVGLQDGGRGQMVVAAIVAHEGAVLDFQAISKTLKARLSSYKVPRAFALIMRAEVPLLASNKVSRRALAEMLSTRLGG